MDLSKLQTGLCAGCRIWLDRHGYCMPSSTCEEGLYEGTEENSAVQESESAMGPQTPSETLGYLGLVFLLLLLLLLSLFAFILALLRDFQVHYEG